MFESIPNFIGLLISLLKLLSGILLCLMLMVLFFRDKLWVLMMKYDDDIEVHAKTDISR